MDDLLYAAKKSHIKESKFNFKQEFLKSKSSITILELNHYIKLIPVFEPTSKIVIFWEIFHIITILTIFFWMPFKFSFGIDQNETLFFLPNVYHKIF